VSKGLPQPLAMLRVIEVEVRYQLLDRNVVDVSHDRGLPGGNQCRIVRFDWTLRDGNYVCNNVV
jgi:hypothetical protein